MLTSASLRSAKDLHKVPLFKDLDRPTLNALWPYVRERRLRKGEVLFRADDPANELFVICSGDLVMSKPVTRRVEEVLSRLRKHAVFGEMCVFGGEQTRTATVQAETDAILLSLHRNALSRFTRSHPRAAAKFLLEMLRASLTGFFAANDPSEHGPSGGGGPRRPQPVRMRMSVPTIAAEPEALPEPRSVRPVPRPR